MANTVNVSIYRTTALPDAYRREVRAVVRPNKVNCSTEAARVIVAGLVFPGRGTDGDGVSSYQHVQDSPATTWAITHNLGRQCSITLRDTNEDVIDAAINHINEHSAEVTFNTPVAGKAYCV